MHDLKLEALAQIEAADVFVGDEVRGRPGEEHLAAIDDAGVDDFSVSRTL